MAVILIAVVVALAREEAWWQKEEFTGENGLKVMP